MAEPSPKSNNFIWIGSYPECEAEGLQGVKSLTSVETQTSDAQCSHDSVVSTFGTLIANKANGEKATIGLSLLAKSRMTVIQN